MPSSVAQSASAGAVAVAVIAVDIDFSIFYSPENWCCLLFDDAPISPSVEQKRREWWPGSGMVVFLSFWPFHHSFFGLSAFIAWRIYGRFTKMISQMLESPKDSINNTMMVDDAGWCVFSLTSRYTETEREENVFMHIKSAHSSWPVGFLRIGHSFSMEFMISHYNWHNKKWTNPKKNTRRNQCQSEPKP